MKKYIALILVVAVLLWTTTAIVYFQEPDSPYVSLGADTVTPIKVLAGETISVARSFKVTRAETITITRTMIRGDCRKACEVVELPTGTMRLTPGEYHDVIREHVVPRLALPGVWILTFYIHWQNVLGRSLTMPLPPLQIEVTAP